MEEQKDTKNLWWLIALLTFIVVGTVVAVLCVFVFFKKDDSKPRLETPTVALQFDGEKKMLVANNNLFASHYAFYIYDGASPQDIYEYTEFLTKDYDETKPYEKYSLDVTNLFVDAKSYYYYCKCIGGEDFSDSLSTEPQEFVNKHQLSTPNLAIDDMYLTWTTVSNSTGYNVYDSGNYIVTTSANAFDVSGYIGTMTKTSFSFTVKAIGSENYFDSAYSNAVTYQKTLNLSAPTNLRFDQSSLTLSWKAVKNCSGYKILVNNSQEFSTTKNSYDFSSLVSNAGVYSFKVQAIGTGNYITSAFTGVVSYTKTEKLSNVTNIKVVIDGDNVFISWDATPNAKTYAIRIDNTWIDTSCEVCGITLPKSTYLAGSKIYIKANGYNYYIDSNESVYTI